jgi:hypothetical protein
MAVTMKDTVFYDVMSCGSCKNRCFGETYHHLESEKNQRDSNNVSSN